MTTGNGIPFVANMPTEEVFTTPDARRVEGTVASTYPLVLLGNIIRNLRLRFEDGRAVEVHADEGQDFIRAYVATDEGSARLGEVALVDRSSRVGQTGLVFYDTLFDENAAAHIALGNAVLPATPDALALGEADRRSRGINVSSIHSRLHDRKPRGGHMGRRRHRQRDADSRERRLGPAYTLSQRDVAQPG